MPRSVVVGAAIVLAVAAPVIASVVLGDGHGGRSATGGSDGAGGIPYSGHPSPSSGATVPYKLTLGLVVDSQNGSVVGTPVLIMSSSQVLLAAGTTDERGAFHFELPALDGLSLSLPAEGLFDVPIVAGEPLVIVLP